jgi:hypothetical protein
MDINQDILAGKWKQINGRLKQRRAAMIRSERERVLGWFQLQVGLLQERRGRIVARARRGMNKAIRQTNS